MTFWHAVSIQLDEDWTLILLVGLLATILIAKLTARTERIRFGAIVLLLVGQAVLVAMAAWMRVTESHYLLDVRLGAQVVGTLAGIGMVTSTVGHITHLTRFPVPTIVRDTVAAVVGIIAIFSIAARMGVDLSGVIATSAVVTAVIGFSMQDTLGNVIGGLALELDNSIEIGDWVKIGDVSGQVREIRWRYTSIETRNWETVVVPNSVIMKSQVTVLGQREGQPVKLRRWVYFNVDFRTPPSDVIAAATEAIRDCHIDNVATDPVPNCVLMDLGESYAKYAVRYWLTNLQLDDPTDSVVRTRIYFALKRAGIPHSMPAVAAFVTEESTERKTEKGQVEHQRRMDALAKMELFGSLPEDVRGRLADSLRPAPFAAGEIMTRQGAVAHWLYMIVHGDVSVRVSTNGGPPKETARLRDGNFFGAMSLLTGAPRDATLVALTNVDCYRLDRPIAHEIVSERPELAEQIAEMLARSKLEQAKILGQDEKDQPRETKSALAQRIRKFFGISDEVPDDRQIAS